MKTITLTINEDGTQTFLDSALAGVFAGLGPDVVRRASHVEPDNKLLRSVFHIIRRRVSEGGIWAAFTRLWPCLWRVNTSPVGGPILEGRWRDRRAAIAAEVEFLNGYFLTR